MSEEEKKIEKEIIAEVGIPFKKGYQPTEENIDPSNPPQGGSGVPSNTDNETERKD